MKVRALSSHVRAGSSVRLIAKDAEFSEFAEVARKLATCVVVIPRDLGERRVLRVNASLWTGKATGVAA